MTQRPVEQVLAEFADQWMAMPGVEGMGIGQHQGKPCILIFASTDPKNIRPKIPPVVEGHPVLIELTGTFHSLDE